MITINNIKSFNIFFCKEEYERKVVEYTIFSTKELWGYEKVSAEIGEGIAWKSINFWDNIKLQIPILQEKLISLFNEAEKKVVISNETIREGMAEVEAKKAEAKAENQRREEERKRQEEEKKRQEREKIYQIFQTEGVKGVQNFLPGYNCLHYCQREGYTEIVKAISQENLQEEERQKAKKAKMEAEKKEWIEKYGSERLKLAIQEGYEAKKQYILERATQELGESAKIDYEDKGEWQKRSCPSLEAIKLEKELKGKGYQAETVWGFLCDCKEYCKCEKHEMAIVKNFLDTCDVVVAEF